MTKELLDRRDNQQRIAHNGGYVGPWVQGVTRRQTGLLLCWIWLVILEPTSSTQLPILIDENIGVLPSSQQKDKAHC